MENVIKKEVDVIRIHSEAIYNGKKYQPGISINIGSPTSSSYVWQDFTEDEAKQIIKIIEKALVESNKRVKAMNKQKNVDRSPF